MNLINLIGQRFGRWTVQARAGSKWSCQCDCGNIKAIGGFQLRNGKSLSCGCLRAEKLTRHGHAKKRNRSTTYQAWYSMIQRTTNSRTKQFKDYGGRGITVCAEWHDFAAFLADMGERPAGLLLDRIDNERGYSKDNCRWATRAEQQTNQRRTRWLTIDGVTKPLAVFAHEAGLYPTLVRNRIVKCGWDTERALRTPMS